MSEYNKLYIRILVLDKTIMLIEDYHHYDLYVISVFFKLLI